MIQQDRQRPHVCIGRIDEVPYRTDRRPRLTQFLKDRRLGTCLVFLLASPLLLTSAPLLKIGRIPLEFRHQLGGRL